MQSTRRWRAPLRDLTVWSLVFGAPDTLANALLMGASWVINIAVAEWAIVRRARSLGS